MEEVGPEPDITSILALLERYQAPRHGPGLPGGHMTFEEVAHAARHFPPGSWELLGPSPFPPSPRDPPVAITAPPPSPTADAAKAAVAVSPKSPPASVSSVANGAETAKVDLEAIDSSHSAPRERRLYRLVRSLARSFRGLFSRNRKSTASS